MTPARLAAGVALALLLVTLAWINRTPAGKPSGVPAPVASDHGSQGGSGPDGERDGVRAREQRSPGDDPVANDRTATQPNGAREGRSEPREPAAGGLRVVDLDGRPIEGAWASWTPLAALSEQFALGRDHSRVLASSVHALSDADGRCRLESAPPIGEGPWVLWVTHPTRRPSALRIETGLADALSEPIVLTEGSGIRVQVVDAQGRAQAGAELFTFLPDSNVPGADPELASDLRQSFARSARTDDQGWAVLPAGVGHQHVSATHGDLRAPPWYGSAPAEIQLVLAATVHVGGSVRLPAGLSVPDDLRVTAVACTETLMRTLGRVGVAADGSFADLVAHQEGHELQLRVDGRGLIATEQRVPFPPPGGHVHVVLEPGAAIAQSVLLRDEQGDPIHPAYVEAWWQTDSGWMSAQWSADAAGMARVDAPAGAIWLHLQAPGFQASGMHAVELRAAADEPLTFQLERAGRITGRVLLQGQPVPSFVVHYWGPNLAGANRQGVADDRDGRFDLVDAPLGPVNLVVQAEGLAPSARTQVDVAAGHAVEVEIELFPARRARGRVVDALTGEGIAGARVATWIKDGSTWVQPTGHAAHCEDDGSFVFEPLASGANPLEFSAPGYTTQNGLLELDADGGDAQAGTFALVPAQDLVVQLVSDGPVGFENLVASIVDVVPPLAQPFSAEGTAVLTGVPAGARLVRIELPDGVVLDERVTLVAGRPWRLEVHLSAADPDGLDVEVRGPEPLGSEWSIHAITSTGRDRWHERRARLLGGRARIPGPFGEDVVVRLIDGEGRARMTRYVPRAEMRGARFVLDFGDERREFEVVDGSDQPIPGALLILHLDGEGSNWSEGLRTDVRGRAVLSLPVNREVLLHVRLPTGGGVADLRPILPRDRSVPVRVRVETDAALRVRFVDRDVPVTGLTAPLSSASGYRFQFLSHSDAQGVSESGPIRAGSYRLRFESSGYWPVDVPLEVRPGHNELTIPIRRLGGLDLRVVGPEGLAVGGASWALRSVEFDVQVAEWIHAGRVQASSGALVTEADGTLALSGLPNGPYRFLVRAPDGRTASGELAAPPHARGALTVTLP